MRDRKKASGVTWDSSKMNSKQRAVLLGQGMKRNPLADPDAALRSKPKKSKPQPKLAADGLTGAHVCPYCGHGFSMAKTLKMHIKGLHVMGIGGEFDSAMNEN